MNALIVVDVQNDFATSDGALYVPDGEQVVPVINELMNDGFFDFVVLTQDWHSGTHESFASNSGEELMTLGDLHGIPQVWWPAHCVEGSPGAEFHKGLDTQRAHLIVRKGYNDGVDSYSALYNNDGRATGLDGWLSANDVDEVYVCGLATDYCVSHTALDCLYSANLTTYLVTDACRAVNINAGDEESSLNEMRLAGVKFITSDESSLRSNS